MLPVFNPPAELELHSAPAEEIVEDIGSNSESDNVYESSDEGESELKDEEEWEKLFGQASENADDVARVGRASLSAPEVLSFYICRVFFTTKSNILQIFLRKMHTFCIFQTNSHILQLILKKIHTSAFLQTNSQNL